ncbi:MAG TPA: hypothetical protein VJ770_07600 [Stellaceae bacterium]|nr:hypothetical protein [Stellaceae bacterium]
MELLINSAIKAQISTMPDADQHATEAVFHRLAEEFPNVPDLRKKDGNLWELNITPRLLALVRIESGRVEILAVMRLEQLQHYRLREPPG